MNNKIYCKSSNTYHKYVTVRHAHSLTHMRTQRLAFPGELYIQSCKPNVLRAAAPGGRVPHLAMDAKDAL
eukprot:4758764-Pyramimonas_sp.AAC.1